MLENVTNLSLTSLVIFNISFSASLIQLRRIKAVTNTHRELPTISMGRSVDEFFVALDQDSAQGKTLPNWCGTPSCILNVSDGSYSLLGAENFTSKLVVIRLSTSLLLTRYLFQFHRGTLTSHGSIKKGNRECEILLRDIEV